MASKFNRRPSLPLIFTTTSASTTTTTSSTPAVVAQSDTTTTTTSNNATTNTTTPSSTTTANSAPSNTHLTTNNDAPTANTTTTTGQTGLMLRKVPSFGVMKYQHQQTGGAAASVHPSTTGPVDKPVGPPPSPNPLPAQPTPVNSNKPPSVASSSKAKSVSKLKSGESLKSSAASVATTTESVNGRELVVETDEGARGSGLFNITPQPKAGYPPEEETFVWSGSPEALSTQQHHHGHHRTKRSFSNHLLPTPNDPPPGIAPFNPSSSSILTTTSAPGYPYMIPMPHYGSTTSAPRGGRNNRKEWRHTLHSPTPHQPQQPHMALPMPPLPYPPHFVPPSQQYYSHQPYPDDENVYLLPKHPSRSQGASSRRRRNTSAGEHTGKSLLRHLLYILLPLILLVAGLFVFQQTCTNALTQMKLVSVSLVSESDVQRRSMHYENNNDHALQQQGISKTPVREIFLDLVLEAANPNLLTITIGSVELEVSVSTTTGNTTTTPVISAPTTPLPLDTPLPPPPPPATTYFQKSSTTIIGHTLAFQTAPLFSPISAPTKSVGRVAVKLNPDIDEKILETATEVVVHGSLGYSSGWKGRVGSVRCVGYRRGEKWVCVGQ
ncbi:hypothetical protein BC832DRAFT_108319 [Gaertneriomyces semiglobifer]|nr:hypothetical protein BC832DRAFT_108319 [Gaertneriomyces semiglobifer]